MAADRATPRYATGPEKGGDKEPYFQSQRKEIYDRYLEPLIQVSPVSPLQETCCLGPSRIDASIA